jgi:hypothetical protein
MYNITGLAQEELLDLMELLIEHVNSGDTDPPKHDSLTVFWQIATTCAYLRRNRTQADLGETHGVSQPTISRVISDWTPIIADALKDWIPTGDALPENASYLVDGTLAPSWSWKKHPEDWSGKHKTTGRNLIVAATLDGQIAWVSDPFPGSVHDFTCIQQTHILETPNTDWVADKGFIGDDRIITPIKRPPGEEHLHPDDHEFNKSVNSIRAATERANAELKTWRILHTDYRRPHNTHPETITAVLGLEFWRTS